MSNKTFWASRDNETTSVTGGESGSKGHIKIWDKEPTYLRSARAFQGKVFMGIFDIKEWDGPDMEPGEVKEITITFKGV